GKSPRWVVSLVAVKANKRQRADVHRLNAAVRLQDGTGQVEVLGRRRLEMEAVVVALDSHVAGKSVSAVGPPKAGAVVLVERQLLLGQRLAVKGLHREVAVEDVEGLRTVLQEVAVPDRLKTHAIADDEVMGAVDRDPAVAAIPDRCALDITSAHGIAG